MKRNIKRLPALLAILLCLNLFPVTASAQEIPFIFGHQTGGGPNDTLGVTEPAKRTDYLTYSDAAIGGGADSRVYAVTVKNQAGNFEFSYVYSPDIIWNAALFAKVKESLAAPYQSLIPKLEQDDNTKTGLLVFSRDQAVYENMNLDWSNPEAVAGALIFGDGTATVTSNDSAISVTDISQTHSGQYVVSESDPALTADPYTGPQDLTQLKTGADRVEAVSHVTVKTEVQTDAQYTDAFQHMHVTLLSAQTAQKAGRPRKDIVKVAYSGEFEKQGVDSRVYAVTVKDRDGNFELSYVYSPDIIWNAALFAKAKAGLAAPYQSLIPELEQDDNTKTGLLVFSRDQDRYKDMDLDWADPAAVAQELVPGDGTVTAAENDSAISVTDISASSHYSGETPYIVVELINEVGESITIPQGKNRIETAVSTAKGGPYYIVEDNITYECHDVVTFMHVTQLYAYTAEKELKSQDSEDPIDLPAGTIEDDGYSVSVPAGSTIRGGSITASPRSADKGDTVTITVRPDEGYELKTLTVTDTRGSEVNLTSAGSNRYTFAMPASRVDIQVSFKPIETAPVNPFTDVSTGAYYCDAVLWAVENGITNGTGATAFSPNAAVSRAQMVTFLWRAHGAPKATGGNPFTDVSADAWYYDAVLWAAERGVTNGTGATTFSPNAPVSRAQSVTFQWRAAGAPAVSGGSFGDVAADAYYADAVAWAVAGGITSGTGADAFSPDTVVTRAQAITFLWRELA